MIAANESRCPGKFTPAQTRGRGTTMYDDHMGVIAPYSFPSYPDGALYTSCGDLGKLLTAIIRRYEGRPGIISAASFHEIFLPQYPRRQQPKNSLAGNGLDEGIRWQRQADGGMGFTDRDLGSVARLEFDPSTGSGRIFVTNISGFKTSPKPILEEVNGIWSTLAPSANGSKRLLASGRQITAAQRPCRGPHRPAFRAELVGRRVTGTHAPFH